LTSSLADRPSTSSDTHRNGRTSCGLAWWNQGGSTAPPELCMELPPNRPWYRIARALLYLGKGNCEAQFVEVPFNDHPIGLFAAALLKRGNLHHGSETDYRPAADDVRWTCFDNAETVQAQARHAGVTPRHRAWHRCLSRRLAAAHVGCTGRVARSSKPRHPPGGTSACPWPTARPVAGSGWRQALDYGRDKSRVRSFPAGQEALARPMDGLRR